jgi:hypothetical protein
MKRCVMIVGFWLACVGLGGPLAFGYVNGLGRNPPREVRRAYETRESRRTPEQQALLDRWYAAERGAREEAARQEAAKREVLTRLLAGTSTPADRELVSRWQSGLFLTGLPVTDAGLEHLKGLTQLQTLLLDNTAVTDAGLEHLKGLTQLKSLHLGGTKVTDAGVNELRKALPHVEISRWEQRRIARPARTN